MIVLGRLFEGVERVLARLSGADFTIRHRPGRPLFVSGRIPTSRRGSLDEFFKHAFNNSQPIAIWGSWDKYGTPKLTIRGNLTPAQRQRLRNALLECLR